MFNTQYCICDMTTYCMHASFIPAYLNEQEGSFYHGPEFDPDPVQLSIERGRPKSPSRHRVRFSPPGVHDSPSVDSHLTREDRRREMGAQSLAVGH
jgi:hypothetical protein